MRSRLLAPALLALSAVPLAAQSTRGVTADSAACGALAVAVDSLVLHGRSDLPLVLWHETQPVRRAEVIPSYWHRLRTTPTLDSTTWESFQRRNRRARPTCRNVPLPNPLTLRSKRTDGHALSRTRDPEEFWRAFGARYGAGASVATSAVGLSADGRQALLTVMYGCGGLCGAAYIVLLERDTRHRWHVRHVLLTSVS